MRGAELIAFLHNETVRRFAFKTEFFRGKNIDFASDFDIFSALCDSISLFAGHPLREKFLFVLRESLADEIDVSLFYNVEYKKVMWQRIFYEESKPFSKKDEVLIVDTSHIFVFQKSVSLNELVDLKSNTIFDALNQVLEKIKNEDVKMISFDVRTLKYSRPDDFHAGESYKNLINGSNGDVFFLWLLCRVFMNVDLKLRLTVASAEEAEKILNLLYSIKLSPTVYIDFDIFAKEEYQNLMDIVLKNYKKNISLEISIPKEIDENILAVALKDVMQVVPLTCIRVGRDNFDIFCNALDLVLSDIFDIPEREQFLTSLYRVK